MPKHYGNEEMKEEKSTRKSTGKLSDKQKADLKKHMDKLDMSASEKKKSSNEDDGTNEERTFCKKST